MILLKPLMPILRGVATLPMGNLIVFFAIYLGIAEPKLVEICRFSAMQAILLNLALIFPSLVESLFGPGILGIGLPYGVTMVMHNAIFVVTLGAVALAAVGCMAKDAPEIPGRPAEPRKARATFDRSAEEKSHFVERDGTVLVVCFSDLSRASTSREHM